LQSGARTIRVGSSAQGLSVDRDDAAAGFAETRDEFLEAPAELVRVEPAEHPAEGVVVRYPVLQPEKPAEKVLLSLRKDRHIHRRPTARQYRA